MPRGRYDISLDEEKSIYRRGMSHFNAGDFFEAHEAWEDAWNGTSGRRSDFYRGLIQMAVALEHYRRLNGLGARKVFASAQRLWAPLPAVYLGLDLRDFEQKMRRALAGVLDAAEGEPVRFDRSGLFQIDWLHDPFENPQADADS